MKQFAFSDSEPIPPPLKLGYLTNFLDVYTSPFKRIGRGSNGAVFSGIRKVDGAKCAIKVIPKIVTDLDVPEHMRQAQLKFIRREVEILLTLRGTLNVASLEQVFEDPQHVFLVMELCRGGEVVGRHSHYTELEVATILRAVLQTIAQCNAHGIIHRDIKPENFLLLSKRVKNSPVKAIDFGLAAFFTPETLPVTAAQPSGTLWFMSPEATRAQWYPNSDVWSAGCMAAYMLVGVCPFVDRIRPEAPDPHRVFQSIRNDPFQHSGPKWNKMSPMTIDFVCQCLIKDPLKRISATEMLLHPFLLLQQQQQGEANGVVPRPIHETLVQRLQRFAQNGVFKRCLLEHIAADMMQRRLAMAGEASPHRLALFMDTLDVDSDGQVELGDLTAALQHMGFRLQDHEVGELFAAVDVERRGAVRKAELAASLLDWGVLQEQYADVWEGSVRRVFREFDHDGDGWLSKGDIAALFQGRMEAYEVEAVVHTALLEALGEKPVGSPESEGRGQVGETKETKAHHIDFDHVLRLLHPGAMEDLRLFDNRLAADGKLNFSLGQLDEAILARRKVLGGNSFSSSTSNGGGGGKSGMRRVLSLKCLG